VPFKTGNRVFAVDIRGARKSQGLFNPSPALLKMIEHPGFLSIANTGPHAFLLNKKTQKGRRFNYKAAFYRHHRKHPIKKAP